MFEKARMRLSAWYVLIIMLVSFSFSAFIFNGVSKEFQQRLNNIEDRFSIETPRGFRMHGPVHDYFVKDLETARNQVILILLYSNGFLFIVSAALGNYLAGKALRPIEGAMGEQKRFIADASHELKTPITSLQTSIEVALRDKKLTLKGSKKTLKESLDDIEDLKILSNELLALARIDDNGIEKEIINVKSVTDKVVNNLSKVAKEKNIKIVNRLASQKINADHSKIENLITILIDNAIKYTPENGKITISLVTNRRRNYIKIRVKDTGIGIASKEISKIFDRFYRADTSRSKVKVEGYGLGLSFAKKIVDEHGGTINVLSELGKGSIFIVKLPV